MRSALAYIPCLVNVRPIWRGWLISCAWAIAASIRPLDVHEYVFGSQSCAADLKRKTPPTLFRQIGRVWHPGGVRRDARDLGLAPVRRAVPPASLIVESRRMTSSRNTSSSSCAALRREAREPVRPVSLRSTLGHSLCSSARLFSAPSLTRLAAAPSGAGPRRGLRGPRSAQGVAPHAPLPPLGGRGEHRRTPSGSRRRRLQSNASAPAQPIAPRR